MGVGRPTDWYWFFLSPDGRVSRGAYFLAVLLMLTIEGFLLYRFVLAEDGPSEGVYWALAFFGLLFVVAWSAFVLSVKRFHDFDKPGALAICLFVPPISYIVFLALSLIPGTVGANDFGPVTNSRSQGQPGDFG